MIGQLVAHATDTERGIFYKKTYTHLALALLAFIAVESFLQIAIPDDIALSFLGGKFTWMLILGGFWLCSVLAEKWALSFNKSTQYMGLGLYVLLEAIIFLPMIKIALLYAPNIIGQAGIITLALFGGLTGVVFTTKKDFSFLRSLIIIGGFASLGLIVAGAIFGFDLGVWFSIFMILLASGSILYETSQLKNTYSTEQYVGASLRLFASIMLLFWYILRFLMSSRD